MVFMADSLMSAPGKGGKSIIHIRNKYSISKVPLPLKRFFWPKYCKKGQKQQPKAVFRALGCCFSQVFQAVSGSGAHFTNRGTLSWSRRCGHPLQGICSRSHGRLPDRCNSYSIPHRFLRSYGCTLPPRVRPHIRLFSGCKLAFRRTLHTHCSWQGQALPPPEPLRTWKPPFLPMDHRHSVLHPQSPPIKGPGPKPRPAGSGRSFS